MQQTNSPSFITKIWIFLHPFASSLFLFSLLFTFPPDNLLLDAYRVAKIHLFFQILLAMLLWLFSLASSTGHQVTGSHLVSLYFGPEIFMVPFRNVISPSPFAARYHYSPSFILYFALHRGGPGEVRTKLLYSGLIRLKMCPQYSSGIFSCLLPKFIHAEKEGMVYFLGCCPCSQVISYPYARN